MQRCQQQDLTHVSGPALGKRWVEAFISAGLPRSEKGWISLVTETVLFARLSALLYCLNRGGKAEIWFFVLLPSDRLGN